MNSDWSTTRMIVESKIIPSVRDTSSHFTRVKLCRRTCLYCCYIEMDENTIIEYLEEKKVAYSVLNHRQVLESLHFKEYVEIEEKKDEVFKKRMNFFVLAKCLREAMLRDTGYRQLKRYLMNEIGIAGGFCPGGGVGLCICVWRGPSAMLPIFYPVAFSYFISRRILNTYIRLRYAFEYICLNRIFFLHLRTFLVF